MATDLDLLFRAESVENLLGQGGRPQQFAQVPIRDGALPCRRVGQNLESLFDALSTERPVKSREKTHVFAQLGRYHIGTVFGLWRRFRLTGRVGWWLTNRQREHDPYGAVNGPARLGALPSRGKPPMRAHHGHQTGRRKGKYSIR
jgi:hypothetical protein